MEVEQYIILPTGLIRHFFLPFTEAWGDDALWAAAAGEVRVEMHGGEIQNAKLKYWVHTWGETWHAPLHRGSTYATEYYSSSASSPSLASAYGSWATSACVRERLPVLH